MNPLYKKVYILFAAVFLSLSFISTKAFGDDKNWKPVDPSDLSQKEPKVEKDADAEAIFWEVRVDDSKQDELGLKHYIRVKVFTERGREKYSKVEIPFVKGTKIKDVAARVIKPDGTITEINKSEIFENTIVNANGFKIKQISFAVPGIEPGVIFEYRYKQTIDDAGAGGMQLIFQRNIPAQNITYYIKPYGGNVFSSMRAKSYNFEDISFEKDKDGFYRTTQTNVPSFQEEPYMPPEDSVRHWALLSYSSLFGGDSWLRMSFGYGEAFKKLTKANDDVKKTAEQIVSGAANDEEKVNRLFDFAKKEIKNLNFDFSMTDEQKKKLKDNNSAGDTLKQKYGYGAQIEWLFAAMAKAVGLEVRFVLTGDRSEFIFNQGDHTRFVHPACIAVKVNGKWQYYNPGSPYVERGMLAWNEEGQDAFLVNDAGYVWSKIPLSGPEKSVEKRKGKFKLLEDGTLEGEVSIEYTGHLAYAKKSANDEDSQAQREDNLKEEIKKQISEAEISDIRVENVQDYEKPFIYRYKVRVPGYASKVGKRLFLQPGFFEYGSKPVFSTSARKHDIYFRYPWSEEDEIEIMLPKGFVLDNADAPAPVGDSGRVVRTEVKISIVNETNTLVYKRKFHVGGGGNIQIASANYTLLKTLFDAFHKANTHTITLKQG